MAGTVNDWDHLDAPTDAATADVTRNLDEKECKAGFEPWQP